VRSTPNWKLAAALKSKTMTAATDKTNEAKANASAIHLTVSSLARGMASTTPAPTKGRNTMRLSPQPLSNRPISLVLLLAEDQEPDYQEHDPGEESRGVLLNLAGLRMSQRRPGLAGGGSCCIHRQIDAPLV
jgi:hypothetical protein